MKLIVGHLKGGVGKTLTAVHLAYHLGHTGGRVVLIDCDPGSQSAWDWHALAGERGEHLPFDVLPFASLDLPRKVDSLAPMYDHFVADVGGGAEEAERMFQSACAGLGRGTDPCDLIIPCRPNLGELRRIPATIAAAQAAQSLTGAVVYPRVLLVDVPTTTRRDEEAAREFLASAGVPVMDARVRHSVSYPRGFGHQLDGAGEYTDVFVEVTAAEVPA
jgi:chromosome partitioning protein